MMKTKLTLFVTVLAAALFGVGCASTETSSDPLTKGLAVHLTFSGNSQDESGNGNHGGVNGAKLTNDKHGQPNSAYAFDGDDTIIVPENKSFEGEALSVSLWINSHPTDQLSHSAILIAKDGESAGGRQWQIHARLNRTVGSDIWGPDGLVQLLSKSLYTIGGWTHILQTWDGKTLKLYMNGALDTQTKAAGPLANGDSPVIIGKLGAFAFKGSMDDIRIYNRALSAAEVKALYDLEKPKGK